MDILAQLLGFLGFIAGVIVFQSNHRQKMLFLKILASVLWMAHFALLGAWTGAAMNFIGAGRNYVFKQRINKPWADNKFWLFFFIIVFLLSIIFTWNGVYSLFPAGGMIMGTAAFWMKNPKYIRYLTLISSPLWLIYNIRVNSYAGMVTEGFTIISVLIGIYRFDHRNQN